MQSCTAIFEICSSSSCYDKSQFLSFDEVLDNVDPDNRLLFQEFWNKCYFVTNEITKVDYGVFADEKDGQEVYNTEYK